MRPWHQAGAVVSLRQFTNNAFNHHHGIQSVEVLPEGTEALVVDQEGRPRSWPPPWAR